MRAAYGETAPCAPAPRGGGGGARVCAPPHCAILWSLVVAVIRLPPFNCLCYSGYRCARQSPHRLARPRTSALQAGNAGSNPAGGTTAGSVIQPRSLYRPGLVITI